MKNLYRFETAHYYQRFDTWRQKEAEYIISTIGSLVLLGKNLKFFGYGELSFDENDTKNAFASIHYADDEDNPLPFNKKASNVIVFNLADTNYTNGIYDKLAIFRAQSHSGTGQWFSFIAWDEKTGKHTTKEFIDYDYQDLFHALTRWLFHIDIVERNKKMLARSRKNSYKHVA
jgi:hypothetical protein